LSLFTSLLFPWQKGPRTETPKVHRLAFFGAPTPFPRGSLSFLWPKDSPVRSVDHQRSSVTCPLGPFPLVVFFFLPLRGMRGARHFSSVSPSSFLVPGFLSPFCLSSFFCPPIDDVPRWPDSWLSRPLVTFYPPSSPFAHLFFGSPFCDFGDFARTTGLSSAPFSRSPFSSLDFLNNITVPAPLWDVWALSHELYALFFFFPLPVVPPF